MASKEGEGGINWEMRVDIRTVLCKTRSLMRTYGTAQGILLDLWWHKLGRKFKKEWTHVCIQLMHFAVQEKLIQHCKATILQLNKNFCEMKTFNKY